MLIESAAYAVNRGSGLFGGFSDMTLVSTGSQFAQWNFSTAKSRLVGCASKVACIVSLPHFGQLSCQGNLKDMVTLPSR